LELEADFIEPDIVSTRDRQLIALHTVDLNITTNVAQVYPNRSWYSPFAKRLGYWTFNFTYRELSRLTLKQRLPQVRTRMYDGYFRIPRLEDILELIVEWNTEILPLLNKTSTSGLYIELKESDWLLQEAGLDLVSLFNKHTASHAELWEKHLTCNTKKSVYRVPPLVIQSFELDSLTRFSNTWKLSMPPLVLLTDPPNCQSDDFWYTVAQSRSILSGIGPAKDCLEDSSSAWMQARKLGLAVHPWTVRPEELLEGMSNLDEELDYWKTRVQGVFTESVADTVRVFSQIDSKDAVHDTTPTFSNQPNQVLIVAMASMAMGVVMTLLLTRCFANRPVTASRYNLTNNSDFDAAVNIDRELM
jgi:glycerophosphoryl diester phosphodiesterase